MEKDKIVVMSGSFNPPTIAHLKLMEAAMRAIHADKGVFVPVSQERLLQTGDTVLVAGHNGKESFWGRNLYSDKGENHLGKILMKIRDNAGEMQTIRKRK